MQITNKIFTIFMVAAGVVLGGIQTVQAVESSVESSIEKIDDKNFNATLETNQVVVVDFYADWCSPCRRFLPVFEQVANDYADSVKFVKVNVDHAPEIAKRFKASSIPTLIIFKDGKEVKRKSGIMDAMALKGLLSDVL